MGLRDEYGEVSGVPPEPVEDGGERYDEGLNPDYIEGRENLFAVLEAAEAWTAKHQAFQGDETLDARYEEAVELVEGLEYGKDTIRDYCEEQTWRDTNPSTLRPGLFLSALINEHDGEEYALPGLSVPVPEGLPRSLDYLGYRNRKEVTVEGSVGDRAGMKMEGGALRVEGHAGADLGHGMAGGDIHVRGSAAGPTFEGAGSDMEGGTLRVDGTVYGEVGNGMRGGALHVGGEVTKGVGRGMAGGIIELEGDAFLAPEREGGTIYRVWGGEQRRVWPVPDLGVPYQNEVEQVWEACRAWRQDGKGYKDAVEAVEELDYGRDAIYTFAEHAMMDEGDGHFVSALINQHAGEEYTLPDMAGITFVGSFAEDTITVEGDVGRFVGGEMRGGDITVRGDAGDYAGYAMSDGTLTVHGDVGDSCGERIQDGRIEVCGDAGEGVGEEMDDGLIRVHGSVDGFEDITWDGRIEQMQDGEWVERSQGFPEGYDPDEDPSLTGPDDSR